MSRTVVVQNLSAADLATVKAACKASPKPERLAVRDLLVKGCSECEGCKLRDAEVADLRAELAKAEKVTLEAKKPETLED